MSIAIQNMTEFPQKKNQLTMSKHSKRFSFTLEKYNNTLNKFVSVNFWVMSISTGVQIWSKFYPLAFPTFDFSLLISIEIYQEIELIYINYLIIL